MPAKRQRYAPAQRRRQGGFSLAEALIALAIAAGVITAYFQAISTGLDLERRAKAKANAALVAESLIDQLGFELPLEPSALQGRDSAGYTWQVSITDGAALSLPPPQASPSTAGLLTVVIVI
jgi:type II secretory pathway pseudopilin PulG